MNKSTQNEVGKMYRQPKKAGMATLVGLICAIAGSTAWASPLAVTNTFQPNTPATAASVNQNFTDVETSVNDNDSRITTNTGDIGSNTIDINANSISITDHEGRISALEGVVGINSPPIAVDCDADPDAFANTTIEDNSIYELTGMCNGPIEIIRKRNVIIQGDAIGSKDDGVVLPGGLVSNPFAAIGVYESTAELRNLTVNASNYVTNNYSFGIEFVNGLNTGQQAITRVYDVDIIGGDYGISVFRQGYVKIYDNVTVTEWNLGGVTASHSAHAELSETITVTSTLNSSASYSEAIAAWRQGSVDIRNGGTFTAGVATNRYSLNAGENGTISVRNSGVTALNGIVRSVNSSSIRVRGGATITGNIWSGQNSSAGIENSTITGDLDAFDAGYIRLVDAMQSGGYIWSGRNSVIRAQGASSLNTTGNEFSATLGGNLELRDTTTVTSDNPAGLRLNGTMRVLGNTVNFGSIGVTCQSRQNQLSFSVSNLTLGDLSGCP